MTNIRRLPLSAAQNSIWYYEILHPGTPAFHLTILVNTEDVDPARLREALRSLVGRHEMLQYCVKEIEGQFVFTQLSDASSNPSTWPLLEFDLRDLPLPEENQLQATLQSRQMDGFLTKPFDFENDVLWRCAVFHFAENRDVFIFVGHHLIIDITSKAILMRDLTEFYNSLLENRPANLPLLPDLTQVKPPLVDEQKILFWKKSLHDLSPLTLPTDFMPQGEFTGKASRFFFTISSDLTQELKSIAANAGHEISLHRILFAIFFIYLYRITGHSDLCVGTASANRRGYSDQVSVESDSDLVKNVVSDFVNTIPVRLTLTGKLSFIDVVQQLSQIIVAALQNQIPFETLVTQALGKDETCRTKTASPYDVIFNLYSNDMAFLPNQGKAGTPYELRFNHTFVQFLGLNVDEKPDGSCQAFIEYTSLFTSNRIARMAEHLLVLLTNVCHAPQTAIADLSILSPSDQVLLKETHKTAQPFFFNEMNIVDIFYRIAKDKVTANKTAVVFHQAATSLESGFLTTVTETLTYKELDQASDLLASVLRSYGIRPDQVIPDQVVGVSLTRSTKSLVALWSIFKACGIFVPLDTEAGERLNNQITDINPAVILVDNLTQALPQFRTSKARAIINIENWRIIRKLARKQGITSTLALVQPDHLAYMTDTSGSTGTPKRPMNTYRSLANNALAIQDRINKGYLTPGSKVLCTAKFNFDAVIFEILEALMTGGELHLIYDSGRLAPDVLQEVISRHGLQAVTLLPQVSDFLDFSKLPSLNNLVLMGAKPKEETLEQLKTTYNARKNSANPLFVHLEYGVQEAGIFSTLNPYTFTDQPISSIGKPVPNVRLFVLDREAKFECPIGVPGELYIAGLGLARGYYKHPDDKNFLHLYYDHLQHKFSVLPVLPFPEEKQATVLAQKKGKRGRETANEENFYQKRQRPPRWSILSADPTDSYQPTRLYRTGDCVELLEDGSLRFIGRMTGNRQVKIHGVRIELDSIEYFLQRHPNINQSVVVFDEHHETLKAYLLLKDTGYSISPADLNDFLRLFPVPPVARIASMVLVQRIPITSNGKIDVPGLERLALSSAADSKSENSNSRPASKPGTPLEIQLHAIWQETLNRDIDSIDCSFAEYGGNSVFLISILTKIKNRIIKITQRDLSFNMTIRSLAKKLAPAVLANSFPSNNPSSLFDSRPPALGALDTPPSTHLEALVTTTAPTLVKLEFPF